MKRKVLGVAVATVLAAAVQAAVAGEIGFEEDFALAPDRNVPLKQLIAGTEDYYYYHCLQAQNSGDLAKADELLAAWIQRYNRTSRATEMEYRQALLKYAKDPKGSLAFIARQLGLYFNHERETLARQMALPTVLDAKAISRQTLTERALSIHGNTMSGFETPALDWAVGLDLSDERLHQALARLARPDHKDLVKLVLHDLTTRFNTGFGSLTVHRQMLLDQLDELVKQRPALINDSNYVQIYLTKLAPAADVDLKHDPKAHAAYLDRVWAFVSRLGPAHNSLKAAVLYNRLAFDRTQGVWDKDRLLTYLKLPRPVSYINPKYTERQEYRDYPVNMDADYSAYAALLPIHTDEPLVRSYLLQLLVDAKDYEEFAPYIQTGYLKAVFADAKLTTGTGDPESWYGLLTPEQLKALKERIDLDFAYTNKITFAPDEPVSLEVAVKNVQTLIVKVYEINTVNYYRTNGREVDTDINLDGLVPNEEKVYKYTEANILRKMRKFEFPNLNKRGAYIIEFIGNGKSSRALVRKGKLRFLEEVRGAGHQFTILDEANKPLPEATLLLDGKEFTPDKDGTILVPFSTNPRTQKIILKQGDFASLDSFEHKAESYRFAAAFHVERDALIKNASTKVLIRPGLFIHNEPVSPALLEEARLTITSTDRDGVSTSKEVAGIKLEANKETTYEFQVPDRLASITFTVQAKVQNLSLNKKIDVAASRSFSVNAIDTTDKIEDLFFGTTDGEWFIDVLGKTGEIKADRPVNLTLKHRDFTDPVHVTLKTDPNGRIKLGKLADITKLTAAGPDGVAHEWTPTREGTSTYAGNVHGAVGQALRVPYMGAAKDAKPADFSLLELRASRSGPTFVADRLNAVTLKDGFLVIQDLPAGDYSLLLKDPQQQVTLRISEGQVSKGWVLSENRYLEIKDPSPLQIVRATADNDNVKIQLANFGKFTRVHVIATRYEPEFGFFGDLASIPWPEPEFVLQPKLDTVYAANRAIGDEYQYIIDRKYAAKLPGNMLDRPGLLLNPWAIRKTETGLQEPASGGAFGMAGGARGRQKGGAMAERVPSITSTAAYSQYDFLPAPTPILENLTPDDKGVVTIERKKLGLYQQIQVIAVDPAATVMRNLSLPEQTYRVRDLRLLNNLDIAKHFTEQKQITVLSAGQTFTMTDATGSNAEVYDTLPKAYKLFLTLSRNPTLAEFNFILDWPKLKPEQKREKYSKYACHELHYFLYKKDPDFFKAVVLPYLKNKKDKTFMDHYLVGDDLAGYLKPWAFGQLNVVERALLAERIAGEQPRMARHVKERYDLLPPNVEQANYLFNTALKTGALELAAGEGGGHALIKGGAGALVLKATDGTVRDGLLSTNGSTANFVIGSGALAAEGTPAPGVVPPSAPGPMGGRFAARVAPVRPTSSPSVAKADMGKLESAQKELAGDKDQLAHEEVLKKSEDFLDETRTVDRRSEAKRKQFYRQLDKTEEWVENNYYRLPIEQQNTNLVSVNAFWKDFAADAAHTAFLTRNMAEANRNFTEIMFALSNLNLPFEPGAHKSERKDNQVTFTAGSPAIVYHKEIKEAAPAADKTPILVSQNYFRANDRYTYVDNEQTDKYIPADSGEFLTNVVYGCQVVVTNPTSSRQKLDLLLQLPKGALPVLNAQYTRGLHVELQPYQTQAQEYYFYFPAPSAQEPGATFAHYPVHVAKNEKLIAFAPAIGLKVVDTPSKIDTTSWDYISQNGTPEEVLKFLQDNNIERLNLEKIAWRMKDAGFFGQVIDLLSQRHTYNHTLWSYAVKHDKPELIREFLQHADGYVAQVGPYIDSPLLTVDPVIRKTYQHMEYAPLVNARAHKLGAQRQIVNDRAYAQYEAFLNVMRYRPTLDQDDLMGTTYYLLLQDRVPEAQGFFARVDPAKLASRLQYDYFAAYLEFYKDSPTGARPIASKYSDYPVDRWRNLFNNVLAQLDQVEGKSMQIVDQENRNQQVAKAATTEPTLEFKVEARKVALTYQNLASARVNYYLMDIELLFSQNPFLSQFSGQFSFIKPNDTATIELDPARTSYSFDLPEKFHNANVMVEIVAGGVSRTQAYYANSLQVQLAENYGQLKVASEKTGKALPKVYVKAYARTHDGQVKFYKDGYTDQRGMFDYSSLSTNELDNVARFSLLIMSEDQGVAVREAAPPKR